MNILENRETFLRLPLCYRCLLSVFVVVLHMIQKLLEDEVCIHGLADSEREPWT